MPQAHHRILLLVVAGLVIAALGVEQARRLMADHELLKPYDFAEYWSAGRLLLEGRNPYDPDLLAPLERSMYDSAHGDPLVRGKALMMWNPPWTLPLTLPFAALPWRLAQMLWLGLQLAAVLLSADLLWRTYNGDDRQRWVAWLVALTFAPTLFLLLLGQISGLLLLGTAGFLYCIVRDRPACAGCFAALTAIKPHLSPLFALIIPLDAIRHSSARKVILAGASVLLVFSIVPLAWNSRVWADYLEAIRRPPSDNFETMRDFEHPTLGYWLRMQTPGQPFAVQFIPLGLAVVGTLIWWRLRRQTWDWRQGTPWLVLLSTLTAAYGAWAFDLVLLLLPVIAIAVWLAQQTRRALALTLGGAYLLLNFLLLTTIREPGSQSNPWIAPVILAAYAAMTLAKRR
jgi:hypothetical protein